MQKFDDDGIARPMQLMMLHDAWVAYENDSSKLAGEGGLRRARKLRSTTNDSTQLQLRSICVGRFEGIIHASRTLRETTARPKISQIECKMTAIHR